MVYQYFYERAVLVLMDIMLFVWFNIQKNNSKFSQLLKDWMPNRLIVFHHQSFTNSYCTNQQPPQRGGAVPDPVWVGSKWLLAFARVPIIPKLSLHKPFFCHPAP